MDTTPIDDEVVIVVFRGTETKPSTQNQTLGIADWLTDVAFALVPPLEDWGDGVLIHAGFLSALEDIYPSALAAVEDHLESGDPVSGGKKVWVTGHSLGGALASLFAFKLAEVDGVPVQGVRTYGSPRVGNAFWQTAYNDSFGDRAYRWVNNTDPIPHFPVHTPGVVAHLAYRHAGVRTNIYENGVVVVNASSDIAEAEISGAWQEHGEYSIRIYESDNFGPYAELYPSP